MHHIQSVHFCDNLSSPPAANFQSFRFYFFTVDGSILLLFGQSEWFTYSAPRSTRAATTCPTTSHPPFSIIRRIRRNRHAKSVLYLATIGSSQNSLFCLQTNPQLTTHKRHTEATLRVNSFPTLQFTCAYLAA